MYMRRKRKASLFRKVKKTSLLKRQALMSLSLSPLSLLSSLSLFLSLSRKNENKENKNFLFYIYISLFSLKYKSRKIKMKPLWLGSVSGYCGLKAHRLALTALYALITSLISMRRKEGGNMYIYISFYVSFFLFLKSLICIKIIYLKYL